MTHRELKTRLALPSPARIALLVLGLLCTRSAAFGGAVFLPADLEAGATFQLAFVTSGTIRATSSDIATYNAYVMAAARAAGLDVINGQAVTWSAIVSTATVDARDNAPQTAPVYNLVEQVVTSEVGGLWNSRLDFFENPINVTETGESLIGGGVWTGTDEDGLRRPDLALGAPYFAGLGDLSSIFTSWISAAAMPATGSYHVYALSSPIRAVPEPSSAIVLCLGLLGVASLRGRGR